MKTIQFALILILGLSIFSKYNFAVEESYYMILTSYEPREGVRRPTKDGVLTHTFATFARALDKNLVDIKTISWGPCQPSKIRVFPPVDLVLGCNKNLKQTLDKLSEINHSMNAISWGPIQITVELYERAVNQYSQLRQLTDFQKGTITTSAYEYAGIDWTERRKGLGKNCHHMVQDILEGVHGLVNLKDYNYGISAGRATLDLFKNYLVSSSRHQWVWEQIKEIELGNKNYPILKFYEVTR